MKWLKKFLKVSLWLLFLGSIIGGAGAVSIYLYLEPKLPSTANLQHIQFQVPLRIYSADNKLLAEFGEKRRIPLTYAEVPERMIQAFLAAEDDRFFEHPGVDYQGLLRAAYQLVTTGKRRQGGSTITMQVARNFYLSSEKTFTRKLNEILLSLRIENELSKQDILELYLNKIYLGHRSYGIGAAAQVYYGKTTPELTLAQVAMIAGLPKAPSRYNPITNPQRATQRRDYVLNRMAQLGFITPDENIQGKAEAVSAVLHRASTELEAPYIAEMVRSKMVESYGDQAYTNGYNVYTTVHSHLQTTANTAVRDALEAYDTRHGYRGAEKHYDIASSEPDFVSLDRILKDHSVTGDLLPALVTTVSQESLTVYMGHQLTAAIPWTETKWAKPYQSENRKGPLPAGFSDFLKRGDLIRVKRSTKSDSAPFHLAQVPAPESALVALDPNDGAIKSLVGGFDFYHSKFNRVTQAKRQPGSGFKAVIYSAALEAGFTPASLINDAPVVIEDPSLEGAWRPENYSGKFFGPTRLRYALTKSRNLVSIRLLRTMGIKHTLSHAKRFGFNPDDLPHNLSLALGSGGVTPLQMARAYAVLANGGFRVEPYFISRIEDSKGEAIYTAAPYKVCEGCPKADENSTTNAETSQTFKIAERAISPQNHFLMNSMMRDVITYGTGRKARSLGRKDLAGKTGTTNEQRDAWFNGFNRSIVAIAWVGFDSSEPLGKGEVGGRAALPAWISFMREALKDTEEKPLKTPPGIVSVRIDPESGERVSTKNSKAIFEFFRTENAPPQIAESTTATQLDPHNEKGESTADLF